PGAVVLVDLLQGPGEPVEKQLVPGPEIAALGEFLQTLFQTPAPSMGIVQMEDLVDHMVSGKGQAQAVHKTLVEFKAITGIGLVGPTALDPFPETGLVVYRHGPEEMLPDPHLFIVQYHIGIEPTVEAVEKGIRIVEHGGLVEGMEPQI